ncbi:MAG: sensor domain-containing diguanylate cyclase [Actinobacteria bacterium]|nr:sensor domain-containing diguanylate cyclase [Actinomycetota bacterium]
MTTSVADTLTALTEAIDAVAAARSVDEIQRLAASGARRLTGADGATFVMRDGDRCHCVAQDATKPLWKGRRFPLESCVEGWSMLHGEPAVVEDVYADARILHAAYRRTFVRSLLIVPLRSHDPVGAIGTYWAEPHIAGSDEIAVVRVLAASAGVALERATLTQEVERRRITEEDLRELSERDPLTGVLNRRAWDQLLASALRKGTQPLYVALLDLDHFKGYNDRHGHLAGDELLRRAARAWRSAVRAGDVLARYGGEEFAVLLAGCDEDRAIEIAERLRRAMIDEQHVSIGVARWDGRESAFSLIARADHALYDAKRNGRNRVMFAT